MPVSKQYVTGYPRLDITPTGGSMVFQEKIAWADITDRLYEIFPSSTSMNIYSAERDPLSGRYTASQVSVTPWTESESLVVANGLIDTPDLYRAGARVTVTYSSSQRSYNDENDSSNRDPVPFLSHSWTVGGEYVTLDDDARLVWGSPDFPSNPGSTTYGPSQDTAKGTQAGFPITTQEHAINWHKVISPPFETIKSTIGSINKDAIDFETGLCLPQTLLLLGAEISRDITSNGTKGWAVSYRFSERRIDEERVDPGSGLLGLGPFRPSSMLSYNDFNYGGWNHFFDAKIGLFRILGVGSLLDAEPNVPFKAVFKTKQFSPDLFTQVP